MSTSNRNKKAEIRRLFIGLIISTLCAAFGGIYEIFGHGVYSGYMIYAFMLPLILCVIPSALMLLMNKPALPEIPRNLWNYAVATLTVGCILKGVLEIYGTTNRHLIVYPILAGILALAGAFVFFVRICYDSNDTSVDCD